MVPNNHDHDMWDALVFEADTAGLVLPPRPADFGSKKSRLALLDRLGLVQEVAHDEDIVSALT